jgi:hypothetical protein
MRRFFTSVLVFAVCCAVAAPGAARAGEAGDEEELARKEKEALELKQKAAKQAAAAAAEAKKKEEEAKKAAAKTPGKAVTPAASKGATLDKICKSCFGTGMLPNLPYKPYVKVVGGTGPEGEFAHIWTACPLCRKYPNDSAVAADFAAHEQQVPGWTPQLSQMCGGKTLQELSTPYVSVHTDLPAEELTSVGEKLERLAGTLQSNAKSTLLLGTRADRSHIGLLSDEAAYDAVIEHVVKEKKELDYFKKLPSFSVGFTMENGEKAEFIANHVTPPSLPADSAAVYTFGKMLIKKATSDKAQLWLTEGFASYCENVTLGTNNMNTIQYEPTSPKLGKNWNTEIKTYANKNLLVSWERLFKLDPQKPIKAAEYLNCYAMVSCLIKVDPVRFDKMILYIRGGDDSTTAIEKAYGRKIAELQNLWGQWALVQK